FAQVTVLASDLDFARNLRALLLQAGQLLLEFLCPARGHRDAFRHKRALSLQWACRSTLLLRRRRAAASPGSVNRAVWTAVSLLCAALCAPACVAEQSEAKTAAEYESRAKAAYENALVEFLDQNWEYASQDRER